MAEVFAGQYGMEHHGDMLYRRNVSGDDTALPSDGWVCSGGDVVGACPAPKVVLWTATSSWADCADAACLAHYLREDWIALAASISCDAAPGPLCTCLDIRWVPSTVFEPPVLETARAAFAAGGVATIADVIHTPIMNYLSSLLTDLPLPPSFWRRTTWNESTQAPNFLAPADSGAADEIAYQRVRRNAGKFSYVFSRTPMQMPWHVAARYPPLHGHLHDFLHSAGLARLVSTVVGQPCELAEYFLSRYSAGDFVMTRKVAFTLHVTRGWRADHGGLLLLHNPFNEAMVTHAYVPQFNTLTLLDVSRERGAVPHSVSEIAAGVTAERVAITGWFQHRGAGPGPNMTLDWTA